ncbi:hypothetical protein XENTR_v10019874 [Xenopus tropicalis]|uniref:Transcription factor LBX1-like n=1 Tax=Xenopus tropicalis TaxID=8364 RepID=A0A803K6U0_XENTR|nr:transcription factor LBX1-like [Xenopus tropicalis]KAE8581932.1 hypothetical protein XENTR_v10019874 [Xenopus tropicalis]
MKQRKKSAMEQAIKSLTPFSIADILSKPSVRKEPVCLGAPPQYRLPKWGPRHGGLPQASPLCALQELASKTFLGLEATVLQAAEGQETPNCFDQRDGSKKRRKSRTAFTNHQIFELEKRFLYQKYLSPADRDHVAQQLGLSNSQVITWFQNRRAKLKRDLDEMKADVESLKKLPPQTLEKLVSAPEVGVTGAVTGRGSCPNTRGAFSQLPQGCFLDRSGDKFLDEEEIDVDD